MKMKRILAAVLMVTLLFSVPVFAVETSDLLIQEEVYSWGIKDIVKITNFTKYLDKAEYINRVDPEEYGYYEGTDIITDYIEAYGSTTISTTDPSAYIIVYKLKDVNGRLLFDANLGDIYPDMFYEEKGREQPFFDDPLTITEPGYYLIYKQYDAFDLSNILLKLVADDTQVVENEPPVVEEPVKEEPVEEVALPKQAIAKPTKSNVLVNGLPVKFEAYNINYNNYFKLRDLASVLSGSANNFEVTWDEVNQVINLVRGQAYTPVGGELTVGGNLADISAKLNESKIFVDGAEVDLAAYTINGNNYFKLRDVGEVMGFDVTWDEATQTIGIKTVE